MLHPPTVSVPHFAHCGRDPYRPEGRAVCLRERGRRGRPPLWTAGPILSATTGPPDLAFRWPAAAAEGRRRAHGRSGSDTDSHAISVLARHSKMQPGQGRSLHRLRGDFTFSGSRPPTCGPKLRAKEFRAGFHRTAQAVEATFRGRSSRAAIATAPATCHCPCVAVWGRHGPPRRRRGTDP
jgi:hypothetical protein